MRTEFKRKFLSNYDKNLSDTPSSAPTAYPRRFL